MGDFRKLSVWQKGKELALETYRATDPFPSSERYGLSSQMRRAAISVISNIAEGCGRNSDPELGRFLAYSLGSLSELECQVIVAGDLGFLSTLLSRKLAKRIQEIRRMAATLVRRLQKGQPPGTPRRREPAATS